MDFCASYFGIQGQSMKGMGKSRYRRAWNEYRRNQKSGKGIVEVTIDNDAEVESRLKQYEMEFERQNRLCKKWKNAIIDAVNKMNADPHKNWIFEKKMFNGCTIKIWHENGRNYIRCMNNYGDDEIFEVNENLDIKMVLESFELVGY